jgi:hypothetical protein
MEAVHPLRADDFPLRTAYRFLSCARTSPHPIEAYSWGPHWSLRQWVEAKRTVLAKRTNSLAFGKHQNQNLEFHEFHEFQSNIGPNSLYNPNPLN